MPVRILAVEQDALQREVLSRFLEHHGFCVQTAADWTDVLCAAQSFRFDLMLVDDRVLPSGEAALARFIAGLGRGDDRPRLVALSDRLDQMLDGRAREADLFDLVLRKPWDPGTLLGAIRHIDGAAPFVTPHGGNAQDARPEGRPEGRQNGHQEGRARILVVDDDDMFRRLIAAALQNSGHAVLTAPDGFRALQLIRQFAFDVALIDFNLPDLDGVAVANLTVDLVRAAQRPRLIALTATPDRVTERQGVFVSHFDDIICKSAGLLPVLEAVQRCARARTRKDPGMRFPAAGKASRAT